MADENIPSKMSVDNDGESVNEEISRQTGGCDENIPPINYGQSTSTGRSLHFPADNCESNYIFPNDEEIFDTICEPSNIGVSIFIFIACSFSSFG